MDLSDEAERLRELIISCIDPARPDEERTEARAEIARDFPYADAADLLGDLTLDPATPPAAASAVLQILYVGARKGLEAATPDAFGRVMASRHAGMALKTQALLHLLLLDLDEAERCALRHLPSMMTLVQAERLHRTQLGPDLDAVYDEALLHLLPA